MRNHGMQVRVARFHNIFGPYGTWQGGREKAPAALCRKIAELPAGGGKIEMWGDGEQTRSFLFIDECLEACIRLVASDFAGPVNVGSEEMVTINDLVHMIACCAGKHVIVRHVEGPVGVRGRTSNNELLRARLGWEPTLKLHVGLQRTYAWIAEQVAAAQSKPMYGTLSPESCMRAHGSCVQMRKANISAETSHNHVSSSCGPPDEMHPEASVSVHLVSESLSTGD
jgi:dTDP-D-glucose 4,6-dehydratase